MNDARSLASRLASALGLDRVEPTGAEVESPMPGDDLVRRPDAVMDRAFTLSAPPHEVWPWLVQLGKWRAGWYLPRRIERFLPPGRRAVRHIDTRWQNLRVGDVIPDYGGRDETFTVNHLDPPTTIVYTSERGRMRLSWAIRLTPSGHGSTRVRLRLRMGPIRRLWLVHTVGELVDLLTIAGLAAGLAERVRER
ncbi:MAG: SRPBCC family protein [Nocardioides sp.]